MVAEGRLGSAEAAWEVQSPVAPAQESQSLAARLVGLEPVVAGRYMLVRQSLACPVDRQALPRIGLESLVACSAAALACLADPLGGGRSPYPSSEAAVHALA